MIAIKLNKKKVIIKPYRELLLKEYRDIIKAVADIPNYSIIDYIAYMTNMEYHALLLQKLKGIDLLADQLGAIKVIKGENKGVSDAIEDQPLKKYMVYDGRIYDLSKIKVKSKAGYRVVITQFMQTKPTYIDLYVHVIASVLNFEINKHFDYDAIREIAERLENYNAYHVLGNGAFFLSNLQSGKKSVKNYLKAFLNILTKMKG